MPILPGHHTILLILTTIPLATPQTIDYKLLDAARRLVRTSPTREPCTPKPTPCVRDHIRIVESFHRSLNDMHYRNIWYGLIEKNYSLLIENMRRFGPHKFMKKSSYNDPTFEGTKGKRLWNFTIEYFDRLNKTDFLRMIQVFKREDEAHTRDPTPTRYATIPLPKGYWEKANKEYWATYTDPPGLNPWRNTIPYHRWHDINYDYIWPKDNNVYPYIVDGRVSEWWTRAEWTSTPYPGQEPRPFPKRLYNKSDLWKYDLGIGMRYHTSPNYYY
uniref:Uncharacterized protein n=1 Tax=Cacopsylla melanoneura TaxID=428564 RepID=A0A8D8TAQ0_9HEMI